MWIVIQHYVKVDRWHGNNANLMLRANENIKNIEILQDCTFKKTFGGVF